MSDAVVEIVCCATASLVSLLGVWVHIDVCAAVCCSTQQHRGGGSERQKSTLYIEKYINLRSIITTNKPDKH